MNCVICVFDDHLLSCNITNQKNEAIKYEEFLNGSLHLKIEIFKNFEENINIIKQLRDSV